MPNHLSFWGFFLIKLGYSKYLQSAMNIGNDAQTPGFSPGLNSSTRLKYSFFLLIPYFFRLKPNLLNVQSGNSNNLSNINSSNEDENLIKSRREAKEPKEARLIVQTPARSSILKPEKLETIEEYIFHNFFRFIEKANVQK